jgi:hypothetical protein
VDDNKTNRTWKWIYSLTQHDDFEEEGTMETKKILLIMKFDSKESLQNPQQVQHLLMTKLTQCGNL